MSTCCILNLPGTILDNILERLSPNELCSMSEVCTFFMPRCRSNRLWDKHLQRKWGRLLGHVAYKEWKFLVLRIINEERLSLEMNPNGLLGSFIGVWPSLCLSSYLENPKYLTNLLVSDYSNMALYVSLQSGRFWFPAQVYQMKPRPRVYDALLGYNHTSNTFQARCPAGEWPLIEKNITWDRLRLPPANICPCTTPYITNNNDLKPGDHVEIQSQRGGLAYDWYYGVIGHLETCDYNNEDRSGHCSCINSEMMMVMFKLQLGDLSPWKSVLLNREVNKEQKFRRWRFGGIRKLESLEDIRSWEIQIITCRN